jgi:GT2 family glycosyltransferase
MAAVDVLIPTCRRKTGLAIVLTSLLGQTFTDFDVIIADQTDEEESYLGSVETETLVLALRRRGHQVDLFRNLPRRGMAHQRHVLLERSRARYVHYLDDDVLLDPPVMARMLDVLRNEDCGFVGAAATGLQYLHDVRPDEQERFEPWDGPVRPEPFTPETVPWRRAAVNSAANPLHLEDRFARDGKVVRYKVAWVGGANVLYDREKLSDVGGFSWWDRLPPRHAGEEAMAQFLLIRKYGGCGVLPSGTYHLCLETNVPDRSREATELFTDLLAEPDGLALAENP